MDPNTEIERILSEEEIVSPSSDFAARVMGQVRTEAAAPEPIEFPWRRLLPGVLTSLSLTLATFMVMGWLNAESQDPQPAALRVEAVREAADALQATLLSPTGIGLLCAAAAATLGAAVAWWATRPGAGEAGRI